MPCPARVGPTRRRRPLPRHCSTSHYENRLGLPIAFADLLYAKDACLEWDSLPGTVAFYVHNYEFMNFTC